MAAFLEVLLVALIVAAAVCFTAWRLMPGRLRDALGGAMNRVVGGSLERLGVRRGAARSAAKARERAGGSSASGTSGTSGCDGCHGRH
jgi:hypothetical protein